MGGLSSEGWPGVMIMAWATSIVCGCSRCKDALSVWKTVAGRWSWCMRGSKGGAPVKSDTFSAYHSRALQNRDMNHAYASFTGPPDSSAASCASVFIFCTSSIE